MAVSLGLKHRQTGEYRYVPVACNETFQNLWIPAALKLGLIHIPHLHDGTYTVVPPNFIPMIIDELRLLRNHAVGKSDITWIVERIDVIIETFETTNPKEWEYDFG